MTALRTTISHCPRVTTGFSTGVSGDANAGTSNIRRRRTCHGCPLPSCASSALPTAVFSDTEDAAAGHTTDGARSVDVGDRGQTDADAAVAAGVPGGGEASGRSSRVLHA